MFSDQRDLWNRWHSGALDPVYATVGKLCRHLICRDRIRTLLKNAAINTLSVNFSRPVPRFRLATNAAEVKDSAAELGLPVIVKPAIGSNSEGVRLCRTADELAQHTNYLLGGQHLGGPGRGWG